MVKKWCFVVVNVVDLRSIKKRFLDICMDEIGGFGVDCVIDNGGRN